MRTWLAVAALNGALAVALGAIGAHALGPNASDAARATFETAVRYHFIHALALLGVAALVPQFPGGWGRRLLTVSGLAFVSGIVLFCGGLYALAGLNVALGARLAPVGGTLFIVGWLALAASALTKPTRL